MAGICCGRAAEGLAIPAERDSQHCSAAEAVAVNGSGGGMSSQLEAMKAKNKAALFWCVCGKDEGQGSF